MPYPSTPWSARCAPIGHTLSSVEPTTTPRRSAVRRAVRPKVARAAFLAPHHVDQGSPPERRLTNHSARRHSLARHSFSRHRWPRAWAASHGRGASTLDWQEAFRTPDRALATHSTNRRPVRQPDEGVPTQHRKRPPQQRCLLEQRDNFRSNTPTCDQTPRWVIPLPEGKPEASPKESPSGHTAVPFSDRAGPCSGPLRPVRRHRRRRVPVRFRPA